MAFLLRKIRRSRWLALEGASWIPPGEVHADLLADVRTENGGKLSVWVIDDDKGNLDRVLAALGGNCDDLSNLDYVLFDESVTSELGLRSEQDTGDSPDHEANALWHRNLVELTVGRVADLARRVYHAGDKNRLLPRKVKELLQASLGKGWLDPGGFRQGLKRNLGERGSDAPAV